MLGNNKLLDVLSADRERIMATIRDQVNAEMQELRRLDRGRPHPARRPAEGEHPGDPVADAVGAAARRRAGPRRGRRGIAQRIRADAERDRTVLLAEARATADKLRGEGEAEATRISAKAYAQDAEFFSIWRTLQAYRDIIRVRRISPGAYPGQRFSALPSVATDAGGAR